MDKVVVDDWREAQSGRFGALRRHVDTGRLSAASLHAELGQIVTGRRPGRERDDERILFWHRGLAILDIAVGPGHPAPGRAAGRRDDAAVPVVMAAGRDHRGRRRGSRADPGRGRRPAGQHRAGHAGRGRAAARRGPAGAGRRAAGVRREHGHGGAVVGAADRAAAAFAPAQPDAGPGDGRPAVAGRGRGPGGHHRPAGDVPVRRRRRIGRAVPAAGRLPQPRHRARRAPRRRRRGRARSCSWPTRSGPWPASAGCCGRTGPWSRRARRCARPGSASSRSARRRASR